MIRFIIDGSPVAKQSVKLGTVTLQNGKVLPTKYTPKEMKNYANWVRICFKKAYPNHRASVFEDKPLMCKITVNKQIPKSFSKKNQVLAFNGELIPTTKPDCDNISKNICDALNEIAYPDDRQIAKLIVEKKFNTENYTVVEIDTLTKSETSETRQQQLF